MDACVLGEGSYGKVYKAFDKLSNKEVAIKQINKSKLGPEEMQLMYQEIELCHVLSADENSLVVALYDVFEDSSTLNLVMELFEGESLYKWMKSELPNLQNREAEVQKVYRQITAAITHLHSRGIVHRDIKLDNFLISRDRNHQSQWVTKVIDFGLSTVLLQNQTSTISVGSIAYLSPEILKRLPYNRKTDVWSMGVVLYTLLTGNLPFV